MVAVVILYHLVHAQPFAAFTVNSQCQPAVHWMAAVSKCLIVCSVGFAQNVRAACISFAPSFPALHATSAAACLDWTVPCRAARTVSDAYALIRSVIAVSRRKRQILLSEIDGA